jgi:metal-responsive CopG/Arc/MetJ family transcriptional regulator
MKTLTKAQKLALEATRASVTFPANTYAELERIAEKNKVSVAWVVRDAVEKYLESSYPLFPPGH